MFLLHTLHMNSLWPHYSIGTLLSLKQGREYNHFSLHNLNMDEILCQRLSQALQAVVRQIKIHRIKISRQRVFSGLYDWGNSLMLCRKNIQQLYFQHPMLWHHFFPCVSNFVGSNDYWSCYYHCRWCLYRVHRTGKPNYLLVPLKMAEYLVFT